MKIAIISAFRPEYGGGSGRVAYDMARFFSKKQDVTFICPAERTGLTTDAHGVRTLGIESIGQGHILVPRLNRRNVNALFNYLDAFSPLVVHTHEPVGLGQMGQFWANLHQVPCVYTAHVLPSKALDFGSSDVFKLLSHTWTGSLIQRVLLDFYRSCDAVIALNQPAQRDIAATGYVGKLFIIPNGRDMETLGRCKLPEINGRKVLTFVGFLSGRKNQRYLVEMLRHLPGEYILRLIGSPIDEAYDASLRQMVSLYGLDHRVQFVGAVPHDDIPNQLADSHVFCSASTMEVQSLAVIEALASGTPVVGLSNETVDELVNDQVGGWLSADTLPEAFAARVRQIGELGQADYEAMCRQARAQVQHLGWPQVEAMTINAYEQLQSVRELALQERQARMAWIEGYPLADVREVLQERVWQHTWLSELWQAVTSLGEPLRRQPKGVSRSTWVYMGLTRMVSGVLTAILRSAQRMGFKGLAQRA